jgi:hypothetical protein
MLAQGIATCLLLCCLAGCRAPVHAQSVLAGTAPGPFGSPAPAVAANPASNSAPWLPGTDATLGLRDPSPDAEESLAAAASRGEAGFDRAGRESGGRFNLFVDPALVWTAQDTQPAGQTAPPPESRWSDFLPIGRAEVLAAGYELPRAFGFGVAYTRLSRDIEVDDVRVGLNGAPLSSVGFLSVKADSVVDNVMGRLDAWIFPFWNVSVLGGWTWNESTSEVTVNIPLPVNPTDVTFRVPTHQDGPTYGFGTNLAAGYGQWFISGDGTWIYADMSDFSTIEGFLGSLRSGWNGAIDGLPVRFWGGATYWDTATTISGSVPTSGGTLRFEVDQGPVTPWSLQVGGSVEFDKTYGIMLEYHMLRDVQMLVVSSAVRF